jgi:hypothetical protein
MLIPKTGKKRKTKKTKSLGALKKDLWELFSLYIKLTHSADGIWNRCFTCDKPIQIGTSDNHGGHWLSKGAYPAHYFNENNVRPQCLRCNCHYGGMAPVFERHLKDEIGPDAVEEMYATRHESVKRTRQWYIEQIAYYSEQIKEAKAA